MRHPSTRAWRGQLVICPLLWERQQVISISNGTTEVIDLKRWAQAKDCIEMHEASLPEYNLPLTFKVSMILDFKTLVLQIEGVV